MQNFTPKLSAALTSVPLSTKNFTISINPLIDGQISGVCWNKRICQKSKNIEQKREKNSKKKTSNTFLTLFRKLWMGNPYKSAIFFYFRKLQKNVPKDCGDGFNVFCGCFYFQTVFTNCILPFNCFLICIFFKNRHIC